MRTYYYVSSDRQSALEVGCSECSKDLNAEVEALKAAGDPSLDCWDGWKVEAVEGERQCPCCGHEEVMMTYPQLVDALRGIDEVEKALGLLQAVLRASDAEYALAWGGCYHDLNSAETVEAIIDGLSQCECTQCEEIATLSDSGGVPHCSGCVEWIPDPLDEGECLCPTHDGTAEERIGEDEDPEGSWSAVVHGTEERWDSAPRFASRAGAEAWVGAWYKALTASCGQNRPLFHLMTTPAVAQFRDGRWVQVEEILV